MNAQFDKLLPLLANGDIEFILVGGVAGNVLGAARLTFDVDVVYNRSKANLEKIVTAEAAPTLFAWRASRFAICPRSTDATQRT